MKLESLKEEIHQLGIPYDKMLQLTEYLKLPSIDSYTSLLGESSEGIKEIQSLLALVSAYGIQEWIKFDPTIVRGLAYYTGIVFEGYDCSGTLRAICGGGRYSNLFESLGSKENITGVGFGFGDAVIVELLNMKELLKKEQFQHPPCDIIAYGMTPEYRIQLIPLVQELRKKGHSIDLILEDKKTKYIFQKGNRLGVKMILILGENEMKQSQFTLKDLTTGIQITEKKEDIIKYIEKNKQSNKPKQ
jgi:histidyl-tRNA synthetase